MLPLRAVVFDLDETLAESFMPPEGEMIERILKILERMPVAIMSGRDFERIQYRFLPFMTSSLHIDRLYVFPESASHCFTWNGSSWVAEYSFEMTQGEFGRVRRAIEESLADTGALEGQTIYGEQYIERSAQMAFTALGIDVPKELKYTWDPGNEKRRALQASIARRLPDFEVMMGGVTTLDITKRGFDKSHGVRWLSEHLHIPPSDMLYVGDTLYNGGNDSVVIPTGIQVHAVANPKETALFLDKLLSQPEFKNT